MAVTPSSMLPLGTPLPDFALVDAVSGQTVSSAALTGKVAVVAFICNHCPFVVHIKPALSEFGRYCKERSVPLLAISANDVTTHPMDGPAAMAEDARREGYVFPYLFDESQRVARAFDARCTPEFYVFDVSGKLAYRGQFDDARPSRPTPVTGADVRAAVAALLEGKLPEQDQKPGVGCNIKWKPGMAPA